MSLAPRGLAAPTADDLRKIIADRCGKVDRFSMVCDVFYCPKNSGSWCDEIRYQFDRPTRRLLVKSEGPPALFLNDHRAYFLLLSQENESSTYLEIHRDRAIGWNDILAAGKIMRKECEPYGMVCCPYELCGEISTCFVAPFLDGGIGALVSKDVQPVSFEAKLLAAEPERAMAHLMKTEKLNGVEGCAVVLGHPDSMFMQSPEEKPPQLAPEKFPLCFKLKDDSHSLVYAFGRENGVFLAVTGTVDHRKIFLCPGNEVVIYAKAAILKNSNEYKPIPFELPKNARLIGVNDLKSECLRILSATSLEETVKQRVAEEEELRKRIREESDLSTKLARLSTDAKTDRKTLEDVGSQLAMTQGEKAMYVYRVAKLQKLTEAIKRLRVSKPGRNEDTSAKKGQ
jgi:hypothetical protein